jgi:hypothetical protein
LTRDNLSKRQKVDDPSCLFCEDVETAQHLFFGCCVAKVIWWNLSDIFGKEVGNDFESIAWLLLCDKKFKTLNICTTAVLWTLWKMRNYMCFQVNQWLGMQNISFRYAKTIRSWCAMQEKGVVSQLKEVARSWEERGSSPPWLPCPLSCRQHSGGPGGLQTESAGAEAFVADEGVVAGFSNEAYVDVIDLNDGRTDTTFPRSPDLCSSQVLGCRQPDAELICSVSNE